MLDGMMTAFALAGLHALAVDRGLAVVRTNECVAPGHDPALSIQNGRVHTTEPEEQDILASLVTAALDALPDAPPGLALLVTPSGRKCCVRAHRCSGKSRVILWHQAGGADVRIAPEAIRSVFHLTPAESRLAAELAAGAPLSAAAAKLGVTMHTARDRLRSIFGKTHTGRQAELVSLILHTL